MKKMFLFMFMLTATFAFVGCDDDRRDNEPASHRVEDWDDRVHIDYVKNETTYSCGQCHASPIQKQLDCWECHNDVRGNRPPDHGAADSYKVSHQSLKDASISKDKPYCIACHTITNNTTDKKGCGCHGGASAVQANALEKFGVGEPIFQ